MYSEYEHLVEMPEGIADNIDFLTKMNEQIESEVKKRSPNTNNGTFLQKKPWLWVW